METLVFVDQHRDQYYSSRGNVNGPARFGSSPSKGFRDINCRTFESGVGLLPSPFKGYGSLVPNRAILSPETQTPYANSDAKPSKKLVKSIPILIDLKGHGEERLSMLGENLSFSELWAGPAYSNSPPPSSLPIPKFSMKPKRTVSLELPVFESDLSLPPMAKSTPASPTRESSGPLRERDDDSATKMLRRMLNLDIADD